MGTALTTDVKWHSLIGSHVLEDGLGARHTEADSDASLVEVLEVTSAIADHPRFEQAVRARSAYLAPFTVPNRSTVRRVERDGDTLRVVADHVDGLRLPDFFQETSGTSGPLQPTVGLELASRIARAAAGFQKPGLSHGTITPAHVVLTRQGVVVLTDCVFGNALEALQRNREQLWREFRVAIPASANLPRFDARSDVTQLGATVLAVLLGRTLNADEYPRGTTDLINEVTFETPLASDPSPVSSLKKWLQQALQLHPRENFCSTTEAASQLDTFLGPPAARRAAAAELQRVLRGLFEDALAPSELVAIASGKTPPLSMADASHA